jgi:hypothetical protein
MSSAQIDRSSAAQINRPSGLLTVRGAGGCLKPPPPRGGGDVWGLEEEGRLLVCKRTVYGSLAKSTSFLAHRDGQASRITTVLWHAGWPGVSIIHYHAFACWLAKCICHHSLFALLTRWCPARAPSDEVHTFHVRIGVILHAVDGCQGVLGVSNPVLRNLLPSWPAYGLQVPLMIGLALSCNCGNPQNNTSVVLQNSKFLPCFVIIMQVQYHRSCKTPVIGEFLGMCGVSVVAAIGFLLHMAF